MRTKCVFCALTVAAMLFATNAARAETLYSYDFETRSIGDIVSQTRSIGDIVSQDNWQLA